MEVLKITFLEMLSLVVLVIGIIFITISYNVMNKAHNIKVNKDNEIKEKEKIQQEILNLSYEKTKLLEDITKEKEKIEELYENEKNQISEQLKIYRQNTDYASDKYFENLELQYQNAETAYKKKIETLNIEFNKTNQELQKLKDTLAASIQARVREKEIQNDLAFYCLQISDIDKTDITRLEQVKKTLNKPRVLSMLIWQTWFQKPLKALSANILGTKTITGIYKITNIETGECYIGQASDIATRWAEHAKCGLGIDTPANNKLYQAMQEYGLWSFSWELLEECPRDLLNEKEKYYIELYDSYNFGYNSNHGVGK
jgi:cell division protein FtsL